MRWICGALLLALVAAGCGSSRSDPTALQRYQSLAAGLRNTTSITQQVARDLRALGYWMRSANIGGTRTYGGHLAWDARRLAAQSAHDAAAIRPLAAREPNVNRALYFHLVLQALSDEWAEAQYLYKLATLAWWDPNMMVPGHAGQLSRLQVDAQWEAWQSLLSARAAQRWRDTHEKSFRYVPVKGGSRA